MAVFDNDGTLWCESPLPIQLAHLIDEVKKQAKENLELKEDPAVMALLKGDIPQPSQLPQNNLARKVTKRIIKISVITLIHQTIIFLR